MSPKQKPLEGRLRKLKKRFFAGETAPAIDGGGEPRDPSDHRKALQDATGIQNDRILSRLVDMQLSPDVVAALTIIPFLEVAWADGEIDSKERELVLQCALRLGFTPGNRDYALLEQWLRQRPDPRLLIAWAHCVEGICEQLSPKDVRALKGSFLAHARAVAQATGGLWGIGPHVSLSEARILRSLETAFGG